MPENQPWFMLRFKEKDPEYYDLLQVGFDHALNTRSIDGKTRYLILLALDVLKGAAEGVKVLAEKAREAGANEDEIREAIRLAYYVNSMDLIKTAANAFD